MKEDVNKRIINKLKESKYRSNLTEFIITLIRAEFAHKDQARWNYSDLYDKNIKESSKDFKL